MKSIKCSQLISTDCNFIATGGHVEPVKHIMLEHIKKNHSEDLKKAKRELNKVQHEIQLRMDSILMRY